MGSPPPSRRSLSFRSEPAASRRQLKTKAGIFQEYFSDVLPCCVGVMPARMSDFSVTRLLDVLPST